MSNEVFLRIPLADAGQVEELGRHGVADIHEALGVIEGRMALMDTAIRPLNDGLHICGQAVTAFQYPGDGLLLHQLVHVAQKGQVLVFANGGTHKATMFAELLSLSATRKGVAGVIADGCIRDTDALRENRFPIWHRGIYAGHTTKRGPGSVNVPVVCGGVLVNPGDIVVADGDGVVVVPLEMLAEVLVKVRARAENDAAKRKAIGEGANHYELSKVGESIAQAKIEIFDSTWKERRK